MVIGVSIVDIHYAVLRVRVDPVGNRRWNLLAVVWSQTTLAPAKPAKASPRHNL